MDHKRGYNYLEDQSSVPSPTDSPSRPKRLKDLSHQHADYPPSCGPASWPHRGTRITVAGPPPEPDINAPAPKLDNLAHEAPHATPHTEKKETRAGGPSPVVDPGAAAAAAAARPDLEKKMEDSAYANLLPVVKKELLRWTFCNNRGTKQPPADAAEGSPLDDETTCAVCQVPKKFKGWDALLIHAQKFNKEMPWQHRGYFRALQEALKDKDVVQEPISDQVGRRAMDSANPGGFTHIVGGEIADDVGVWRPGILIVENVEFSKVEKILRERQEHGEREAGFSGGGGEQAQKPRLQEILAVYTNGGDDHEQRNVFKFPASKVGYVDEKELDGARQNGHAKDDKFAVRREKSHPVGFQCVDHRSSSSVPQPMKKCESLKDKRGLRITLTEDDEEGPHPGKLFDPEQFHRTTGVMNRWADSFKASVQRFEVQRVFRDSSKLLEMDARFREDLKRIQMYTPTCKKKIKEQMGLIEDHLREERLLWLQEVESVREQFEELANNMQHDEERNMMLDLRVEMEHAKEMEKLKKEENELANQESHAKTIVTISLRRAKQRMERAKFIDLVTEDAKLFKLESAKAKEERQRLEKIHQIVHEKAQVMRKECPVCLESFRRQFC